MSTSLVPPIEVQACTMKGDQALSCPIHSKNKKKDALFNFYRRRYKARAWYSKHGFNHNMSARRARGFDCNRPVVVKTLKPGKILEQWVRKDGSPGIDFTEPGNSPDSLGIPCDTKTGIPIGRVKKQFLVTKSTRVLSGWAADFPKKMDKLIGGKGGGRQIAAPPNWQNSIKVVT